MKVPWWITQMAVGLSGRWGRISVMQIRRKCLKWNYYCTWIFFHTSIAGLSCFELGLTVNQNQKRDYIRKQLRKDTSSIYKKTTHFLQLAAKLQHWTACKGLYLQKKIGVYQALSLSLLHWKREQEERSGGVGPWLGPTTQLPFLANVCHTRPGQGSSMPFLTTLFLAIFICNRYIHFALFQIYLILIFYDCQSIFKRTRLLATPFQPDF